MKNPKKVTLTKEERTHTGGKMRTFIANFTTDVEAHALVMQLEIEFPKAKFAVDTENRLYIEHDQAKRPDPGRAIRNFVWGYQHGLQVSARIYLELLAKGGGR